jgi:hypothetical protein
VKLPIWVILATGFVICVAMIFTRSVPYGIILPCSVGWLVSQYVSAPAASGRSKQVVVLVTVWATVLASALPLATIPAVLALVGVGAYILVHHDVTNTTQNPSD